MTQGPCFIGIDLGTGSCKCVVVDAQAEVLGFGHGSYPSRSSGQEWDEQDPHAMLHGMVIAVRTALEQARVQSQECTALSIGGALHSILALDQAGNPLTGILTWADDRAFKQAQAIRGTTEAQELYNQTGCPVHGIYPLYKIRWLKEERPECFSQVARFLSAKEFAFYQLTGEFVCDYGLAGGSGLLNVHELRWNPASLSAAGISESCLSPLDDPRQIFRLRDTDLVRHMGLPPGLPVVLGCSDAANSSLGAGAILPGQATCMVGTSGALRLITEQPVLHPEMRSWCYAMDSRHWLVGGAINNGGIALAWLQDILNQAIQGRDPKLSFDNLTGMAAEAPAGAHGLLCLPFFAGERSPNWNQSARGIFFGLSLHHQAADLARSVLEGVALRFRSLSEMLQEIDLPIDQVRASGGFAHSDLWLQIMASVLGRPLTLPAWEETSSLGAALWAMLGVGTLARLEDMAGLVKLVKIYRPDLTEAAKYDELYSIYTQIYQAACPAFEKIAQFQDRM